MEMQEPISTSNQVKDPICGMKVDIENARFKVSRAEKTYYFCSLECQKIFEEREQGLLYVKDVMSAPVKTIGIESSLVEAVRFMYEEGIGSLVIVQAGKPVGILTDRDALRAIASSPVNILSTPVHTFMSSPLVTVSDTTTTEDAARIMSAHHVKHLPVLREGSLAGMITSTDLVRSRAVLVGTLQELIRARFVPAELRSQLGHETKTQI